MEELSALGFDLSLPSIVAGLLFGVFGLYFFRKGRRDANWFLLFVGLALLIYPYFVSGAWWNWGIGAALTAVGFWL
ncbi:MAG: hypothetical protein HYR96_15385 [Deltaproteobacteria bacterium]|nr:hypothetical protein [Deltaproteobacteria bacterium]MBI3294521.1 hypothetical protein [Deltaproteobacteria bacterium]